MESPEEKLKMVSSKGLKAVFESCLNWVATSPVHSVHLAQNNHSVHRGVSTLPRLPVDVMFGSALRNEDVQTYDEYVKSLQKDLREAVHRVTLRMHREGRQRGIIKDLRVPLWRPWPLGK
ncbi:hypothetical protein QQF64_007958 [Cirrhinus molitorella]|uniref:Uncharacterized protein n=1 Tax=Cirrhinus molitorella TaxID=172907 RepID=A0ABR3M740_9TELE